MEAAGSTSQARAQDTTTRISVSFPRALYLELDRIAKHKKVSVAWVVRDAVERYIGDQWPLFERRQDSV